MGARPLARIIQEHIKRPLAEELFGKLVKGGLVRHCARWRIETDIRGPQKRQITAKATIVDSGLILRRDTDIWGGLCCPIVIMGPRISNGATC